ncbi:MAG: hypothetical protein JNJ41_12415 [Bacteroidia bacterium]|nr:hypothetical protein [Bacteroidia bacterium]
MRKALLIVLLLISGHSFSQLYFARLTYFEFYVEINRDSAHVEIFRYNRYYFTGKKSDEFLTRQNNKGDTLFAGEKNKIIKTKGLYYLLYYANNQKKQSKVELMLCRSDNRENLRKQDYAFIMEQQLMRLEDSLSGPVISIKTNALEAINDLNTSQYSYHEFKRVTARVSDSLILKITELKDPVAGYFYAALDSLKLLDTNRVYNLLSTAKYNFFYGKYLLEKVAKEKPELLVLYVDKEPANKKAVLQAVKYHKHIYEIIKNVKATPAKTKGKKEIIKQKRINAMDNALAGGLYISIILAELALLTLLIVAISR